MHVELYVLIWFEEITSKQSNYFGSKNEHQCLTKMGFLHSGSGEIRNSMPLSIPNNGLFHSDSGWPGNPCHFYFTRMVVTQSISACWLSHLNVISKTHIGKLVRFVEFQEILDFIMKKGLFDSTNGWPENPCHLKFTRILVTQWISQCSLSHLNLFSTKAHGNHVICLEFQKTLIHYEEVVF